MHRCPVLIRLFPFFNGRCAEAAQSTTAATEAMSDRFWLDANCEPRESEAIMELGVAGAADAIFRKKKNLEKDGAVYVVHGEPSLRL